MLCASRSQRSELVVVVGNVGCWLFVLLFQLCVADVAVLFRYYLRPDERFMLPVYRMPFMMGMSTSSVRMKQLAPAPVHRNDKVFLQYSQNNAFSGYTAKRPAARPCEMHFYPHCTEQRTIAHRSRCLGLASRTLRTYRVKCALDNTHGSAAPTKHNKTNGTSIRPGCHSQRICVCIQKLYFN